MKPGVLTTEFILCFAVAGIALWYNVTHGGWAGLLTAGIACAAYAYCRGTTKKSQQRIGSE